MSMKIKYIVKDPKFKIFSKSTLLISPEDAIAACCVQKDLMPAKIKGDIRVNASDSQCLSVL